MSLTPLSDILIEPILRASLAEDYGRFGDLTSDSVVPKDATSDAQFNAREAGILSGMDMAQKTFELVDPSVSFKPLKKDGDAIVSGDILAEVSGNSRSILMAERVALNFLGHMSAIASHTNLFVKKVEGHDCRITCTRKTMPTMRMIQKYAVRCGGGYNHRFALDDAIMIKDNHIVAAGGIKEALEAAHKNKGHLVKIEIEIDHLHQLDEVLGVGADVILLDNMSLEDMEKAVKRVDGQAVLEASGNVTLDRVADIAKTGVNVISSGALTHSVKCLDIGLDF